MSKGSAPSAPDPYTTASAQAAYSDVAASYNAALNRVNTTGPTGSTQYKITGTDPTTGAPIYSQATTLSAPEQQILGQTENLQSGQLTAGQNLLGEADKASAAGEPSISPVQYGVNASPVEYGINTSGVPGIAPTQDYEQYGQQTALAGEEAAIQPGQQAEREQTQSQLINSGIHPGDPAWETAMSQLDANQTNAQTQAAGAAITAGTGLQNTQYGEEANTNQQLFGEAQSQEQAYNAAQQQQFGEGTSNAQLNNSAGTTALANYAQETGIPINELESLLSGSQISTPTGNAPGQATASTPDIMSAFTNQYNGELAKYNAGVATTNSEVGDAATLGTLGYLAYAAAA